MPFVTPTAKTVSTKLIPYRPQGEIYQYLRFNSSVTKTKQGDEYVQKNRTVPQRSYKYLYKTFNNETFRLESILFNPELFYLPIWDQVQRYNKTIEIGDTFIDNITSISDTDMLFWLLKDNFIQDSNGDWFAQDALGSYFPTNGQPRQRYILDFNNGVTGQYVDTGIKPADITSTNPFEVVFKHQSSPSSTVYFYESYNGDYFSLRNLTLGNLYVYYSDANYENFNPVQIGGYVNKWIKLRIIKSDLTHFDISLWGFDGIINGVATYTQISTTRNVAIGNMATYNIPLGARNINGSIIGHSNIQVAEFTANGITYYPGLEEVGKYIVGSDGSILEIANYTSAIYSLANEVGFPDEFSPNSDGFVIANGYHKSMDSSRAFDSGTIIRQDPNNPTKALCKEFDGESRWLQSDLDYSGQCQYPAKITGGSPNVNKNYLKSGSLTFPICPETVALDSNFSDSILNGPIKVSDLVKDYEDEHFLFANTGTKTTDIIGFKTVRTSGTDPTINEVLYYDANDTFTATNYDFEVGQWVLIWQDENNYELINIGSVVENKISFANGLPTKSFINPKIIPVFKALLQGNPSWTVTQGNIYANCSLDFKLVYNSEFDTFTPIETYDSIMVLAECNYYDGISKSNSLDIKMITTDFNFGGIDYYKNFKQSVNIKSFGMKAEGRTEIANMLSFINYLNGQQRVIWIPTLQRDFEPQANITSSQTVINIDNKGLLEYYSSDGFSRAVMLYHNGSYYYSDVSDLTETDSDTEQVTLSTAFGVDIDITYDNFFICWIIKGCLNNDQVDIRYINKSAYAMLNFREVQA